MMPSIPGLPSYGDAIAFLARAPVLRVVEMDLFRDGGTTFAVFAADGDPGDDEDGDDATEAGGRGDRYAVCFDYAIGTAEPGRLFFGGTYPRSRSGSVFPVERGSALESAVLAALARSADASLTPAEREQTARLDLTDTRALRQAGRHVAQWAVLLDRVERLRLRPDAHDAGGNDIGGGAPA